MSARLKVEKFLKNELKISQSEINYWFARDWRSAVFFHFIPKYNERARYLLIALLNKVNIFELNHSDIKKDINFLRQMQILNSDISFTEDFKLSPGWKLNKHNNPSKDKKEHHKHCYFSVLRSSE